MVSIRCIFTMVAISVNNDRQKNTDLSRRQRNNQHVFDNWMLQSECKLLVALFILTQYNTGVVVDR